MAHPGLNRLSAHQEIGLGLLTGPVKLLLGRPLLEQPLHYVPDRVQGLALLLFSNGGIDAKKPCILVVGHIGVDGIAQAALLPDLLKQARGAPSPQQGVEQLELPPPGVQIGRGGKGQDQVVLLNGLLPGGDRRAVGGWLLDRSDPRLQSGQAVLQLVHLAVRKAACQGGNQNSWSVVLPPPLV